MKLLPGQLLGIQQTVREARPPPLPHRPPLPTFESAESPYAHIDELDIDSDTETAVKQPEKVEADVNTDR